MSGRGRRAALPRGKARTARGVLTSDDGRLLVRAFNKDGSEHQDFDFSVLAMADDLRDALAEAFAKRCGPGGGRTTVASFDKVYRALTQFARYLATLAWPPRHPSHLACEHIDGFYDWRGAGGQATADLGELRNTLLKVEGLTDEMTGRLATPLPKRPEPQRKNSYSSDELGRIAEAARGDLRAAAKRIRANRDLLARVRAGDLDPGGDAELGRRLRLLDWVERFADVPRQPRKSGKTKGRMESQRWVMKFGTVAEIVGWLHLSVPETAAGAVLLGVMTGENPEVILKTPAVHHRADGYTGQTGTAIVDLLKPRRQRRAHMTLALSEVPDWISIPDKPEKLSSRDELHTPFGLYVLLHELTTASRALVGGNRLLVNYSKTGGGEAGRGLRPIASAGEPINRFGRAHQLMADEPDKDGNPVPLDVRLDLLRLTYIELHQKPVAHSEATAATQYLARNRGNISEYRKVVADTLTEEVTKARTRGTVAVMSAADVERARTEPEAVAAEQNLDATVLKRMIAGELDTVMAACTDNTGGRYSTPGQPCRASFMLCLDCECARALPRHLPVQVLVHDRLAERHEQMDPLNWAKRFARPHAQLADLLDEHDETAVDDARADASEADRALVERFLNRELDWR
ncbi:hypothetical protein ACF1A9_27990 [Streptomyces sp. NPDC014872]|uniref:hypothetical protein n=1 Tax=Streptomyces sp. NPDC014872 TaxID=3364926 RepID=UPI0036FF6E30